MVPFWAPSSRRVWEVYGVSIEPSTVAAIVGAVAYAAAHGIFRAWSEHRRREGSSIGPRLESTQQRVSRIEGLLGIDDDTTPTERPRH